MRFASVETGIWRWFSRKGFVQAERDLMFYLLTNAHTNMVGYYYLPKAYVMDDTGMDAHTLESVFGNIRAKAKVLYDDVAKVVLLPDFLEHAGNKVESEKQLKGALKVAREVPQSVLLPEFVKAATLHCPKFATQWEGLLIGYRYPTEPLSITGTGTVSGTATATAEEEEAMRLSEWVKFYESKFVISPSGRDFADFGKLQEAGVTDDLIIALLEEAIADESVERPLLLVKRRISDMLPRGVKTRADYEKRKAAKVEVPRVAPYVEPEEDEVTRRLRELARSEQSIQ